MRKLSRQDVEWQSPDFSGKWIALGSIIERSRQGDVIWGSGSKFPEHQSSLKRRIVAVRGPRTLELLRPRVSELTFGDPAILLPLLFPQTRSIGDGTLRRIGLIPHYVDSDILVPPQGDDKDWVLIDVQGDWRTVISLITSCDLVVSSSLHGIIVAEAYGISAVWVQPSDRIFGGTHKFHDYFEGTGRSVECANWGEVRNRPEDFAVEVPSLAGLQKALIQAFFDGLNRPPVSAGHC